jgi:hypothetical protein
MIRIGNTCIDRTNVGTLRFVEVSLTFNAFTEIDSVNWITFTDSLNGAFRFTKPTCGAFIINQVRHIASINRKNILIKLNANPPYKFS